MGKKILTQIPDPQLAQLDAMALAQGRTRSSLIREAIRTFLSQEARASMFAAVPQMVIMPAPQPEPSTPQIKTIPRSLGNAKAATSSR